MKGSTRSTAAMMAVAALFAALRWPDGEAPQQAGWKLLATSPYLTVNDGLLNADEVSQLLDMASEQDMAPCTGNWKAGSYEDTRSCGLLPIGNNSLLLSLRAKLGTELGVDVSDLTHLPLRLSAPGTPAVPLHNEYRTLDGAPGAAAADVHPYAVALMYLQNGAPEGSGRLNFPLSGISIEAKPGALVFFRVLNDAGELCPYHAHAVDSYPANSTSDKLVITISFDAPSGQGAASTPRARCILPRVVWCEGETRPAGLAGGSAPRSRSLCASRVQAPPPCCARSRSSRSRVAPSSASSCSAARSRRPRGRRWGLALTSRMRPVSISPPRTERRRQMPVTCFLGGAPDILGGASDKVSEPERVLGHYV